MGEQRTAWVAFTDVTPENGYMQFIPGSHRIDQLPHVDTFHRDNLLSRGQEIAVDVDKTKAVGIPLTAGEMSLHHVRLVHGSPPNRSGAETWRVQMSAQRGDTVLGVTATAAFDAIPY